MFNKIGMPTRSVHFMEPWTRLASASTMEFTVRIYAFFLGKLPFLIHLNISEKPSFDWGWQHVSGK
jgi:hypothetical protein